MLLGMLSTKKDTLLLFC